LNKALERLLGDTLTPLGKLLTAYARLFRATATMRAVNEPDPPAIFVNWHRDLVLLMIHHGERHRVILMMDTWNMRPIAQWGRDLGLKLIRGATGMRGRDSQKDLAAALDDGESIILAVDGPAGPRFVCRPGCVHLARATGRPIVPVTYKTLRDIRLRQKWDHMRLHLPLEDVEIIYGDPVFVDDDEDTDAALARVTEGLRAIDPFGES
jgi:lysophospholipid acyltransferase (LPLAT)-like uncharacterized protein